MSESLFVRLHAFAIDDGVFFGDENLMEEPIGVGLQQFCNARTKDFVRFSKTIHNLAQMSLINAEYLRHSVLAKAAGIDSQFQVRINITVYRHSIDPM